MVEVEMLDVETHRDRVMLVLTPNRSMSWRSNKYVLGIMTLWSGIIGLGFLSLGAWVIMPFIGLELLALSGALYYVSWKLSHREVLHINAAEVRLERGIRWPKKSWCWPRQAVQVAISVPKHDLQTPTILFTAEDRKSVQVGEFLNQDDCKKLIKQLIASGLPTRRVGNQSEALF